MREHGIDGLGHGSKPWKCETTRGGEPRNTARGLRLLGPGIGGTKGGR